MEEKEILEKILEENKKRTFYAKIAAAAMAVTMAVIVICLLKVTPRINNLIGEADKSLQSARTTLTEVENAAKSLSGMSKNIETTSTGLNDFVTDNSQMVSDAMEKMGSIDYEGLNRAIRDLQDAVEPFAKFVNRFK